MLSTLSIRDFALIESQQLDFQEGLTVISGETGAGKSILIDALGLLLGKRASREYLRQGRERALVEALFSAAVKELSPALVADLGLEGEDIILSRELRDDGRSFARINGRLVTLDVLAEVSGQLLAIHGQNSQEEIYEEKKQKDFLDRFGGKDHQQALVAWQHGVHQLKDLLKELKELGLTPRERARELELLNYQIDEIETAAIQPGEDEKLMQKSKQLSALEKIQENLAELERIFSGSSDSGIQAQLQRALVALEYPAKFSKKLSEMRDELLAMSESSRDFSYALETYQNKMQADENELSMVQERLDELNDLKRKYGDTLDDVLRFLDTSNERKAYLEASEKRFSELQQERLSIDKDLDAKAKVLTEERQKTAQKLEVAMTQSLRELNLPHAIFKVSFLPQAEVKRYPLDGRDNVSFSFSANKGEELKPLSKVASGGEASRLILALKSLIADQEAIGVLIFDEIDQGIGGKTASKIAERLQKLSLNRQVLCVSHSATVAAAAKWHFLIEKNFVNQRTITEVHLLDANERVGEVARLLAGDVGQAQSQDLARTLLTEQAQRLTELERAE